MKAPGPELYFKDGRLHPGLSSLPTGLGVQILLPHSNRLGSLASKQPTAQFHAFLLERLCTVCPCGHGDEALETCKLSRVASHEHTKSVPPSHLPDVKTPNSTGDTGTPLMSRVGVQSQPMSRGMWWGGWSDVRATGSREEVSRVSHGHTPLPPAHMPCQ